MRTLMISFLKRGPSPSSSKSPLTKFMVGLPINPATKRFAGRQKTSSGVPTCWMRPALTTAMREPKVMASTWSWVT